MTTTNLHLHQLLSLTSMRYLNGLHNNFSSDTGESDVTWLVHVYTHVYITNLVCREQVCAFTKHPSCPLLLVLGESPYIHQLLKSQYWKIIFLNKMEKERKVNIIGALLHKLGHESYNHRFVCAMPINHTHSSPGHVRKLLHSSQLPCFD